MWRLRHYALKEVFCVLVAQRITKQQDILRKSFVQIIFWSKQRTNPLFINAVTVQAFKQNKLGPARSAAKLIIESIFKNLLWRLAQKLEQHYLSRHQIQKHYLYMSQAKFKTTFPLIALIGAAFGLYIIGTFGKITAEDVQFSSSFLLAWKLPELLHGFSCFSATPILFKLRQAKQTSIDGLKAFRCTNRKWKNHESP